ncbi:MAG: CopD family protein [Anaerolineae bacterium]
MMRPVAAVGAILALLIVARVAYAHANLVRADPPVDSVLATSPATLRLWFSEKLEPGFSDVRVLNAARQQVDRGDSHVAPDDPTSLGVSLPPLDPGVYTVAWRTLSAVDGHPTGGVYNLSIGVQATPQSAPTADSVGVAPLEAPGRWLGYLGAAGVFGGLLFDLLVFMPVARRQRLFQRLAPAALRGRMRLLWVSWALLLLGAILSFAVQVYAVGGGAGSPLAVAAQLLGSTRYGTLWLARVALIASLAVVIAFLPRRGRLAWGAVALAAGVMLTSSLNSHSVAAGAVAPLVDWAHYMAVAVWVGGLFALALLMPPVTRPLEPAERNRLIAGLIPQFSRLALVSVGVLFVTGLYLTWLQVGSLPALVETLYGQSLLVKLSLFVVLIVLGALNQRYIGPRLTALTTTSDENGASRAARSFRRAVSAEVVLVVAVLLVVGMLTALSPARQIYDQILQARPLEMTAEGQNLQAALSIAPARPGFNTFAVTLADAQGQPIVDADRVDLRFTYLDDALGTNAQTAANQGGGRYTTQGPFLGVEGRWQVELLVRRPGQDDSRAAYRFYVTPQGGQAEGQAVSPTGFALPALNLLSVAAVVLVLLGVALIVFAVRRLGWRTFEGVAFAGVGGVLTALAVFLFVQAGSSPTLASLDSAPLVNPIPPTDASVARGREVYERDCLVCHGARGRGDGPMSVSLNPRPADFRVHMAAGHTDAQLFDWITNGVQGTGMPPFSQGLSVDERWDVINYIRTFAPPK